MHGRLPGFHPSESSTCLILWGICVYENSNAGFCREDVHARVGFCKEVVQVRAQDAEFCKVFAHLLSVLLSVLLFCLSVGQSVLLVGSSLPEELSKGSMSGHQVKSAKVPIIVCVPCRGWAEPSQHV